MEKIEQLRQQIDAIDKDISALLVQRFDAVKQIGAEKKRQGIAVTNTEREKQVIAAAMAAAQTNAEADAVAAIYAEIIAQSKTLEK